MIETKPYADDGGVYRPRLQITLLPENVQRRARVLFGSRGFGGGLVLFP